MSSIFSKILKGQIPCFKIAEDEHFLAFLDIEPVQMGHVLIVSKQEVDKFYDLDDTTLSYWMPFAKPIAKAIEDAFQCSRVGMSFIGLEVAHAHMHLIPINNIGDMNFVSKPPKPSMDELKLVQERILKQLQ